MSLLEDLNLPQEEIRASIMDRSCPIKGTVQNVISYNQAFVGDIILISDESIVTGVKYCSHSQDCKRQRCLEKESATGFTKTLDSGQIVRHNNSLRS